MKNLELKIKNLKLEVKNSLLKQGGFTLMELVLYMGLFSALLVVLTSAFASSLDSRAESQSISGVEQDARFLLYRFTRDILQSSSILVPQTPGTSDATLQIIINGTTNTYSLASGNLILVNDKGTNTLNNFATTISNLEFTRRGVLGGKNTITIAFTITSRIKRIQGFETKSFKTTIGQR